MFKKIGVKAKLSSDYDEIMNADKLVLPGVGSFDKGIKSLNESGLLSVLEEKVVKGKTPLIGICLGMQLLMEDSEEGMENGLGWIEGRVKKFKFNSGKLKIPHMGWNIVRSNEYDTIFAGLEDETRFYFVHSYYVECRNNENVLGVTDYGIDFVSAVRKDNIFGVQFHPEKSHRFGRQVLKNFSEL